MADKRSRTRKHAGGRIAELLAAVEDKFGGEIKWTIGDYIRLLQAWEEFDRETPRNIEVTWVDSLEAKKELEE